MAGSMRRIGEVIQATSTEVSAQCYELYGLPPLGSLVKTADGTDSIYAIVVRAETSSIEPGRHPIARGKDEPDEDAVYRANPQLAKLLRSQFTATLAGYSQGSTICRRLPSSPPHIHSFVYLCEGEEVRQFCESMEFLNMLLGTQQQGADEILAATLREISKAQEDKRKFLVAAGKELAKLLGNDYSRLRLILGRLESV